MMQSATNASKRSSAGAPTSARPWATAARLVAPVLLSGAFVMFAFFQGPDYSRMQHTISDMYALGAPAGALLSWIIAICGALTIAFVGWGLYPALGRSRMAIVCGALFTLSIYGIGDLFAPIERLGCRMADAGCTEDAQLANFGGFLDATMSTIGIFVFIAAVITVGFTMKNLPRFKAWANVFIAAGFAFAAWVLIGGFIITAGGLWERVAAYSGAAWPGRYAPRSVPGK